MFLSFDTETGGLGVDKSLLTMGFVLANDSFEVLETLHLQVKPDDGVYKVDGYSFNIHKINLALHDEQAMTYKVAKPVVYGKLQDWSNGGKDKLILVGKNVHGDVAQLFDKILSKNTFDQCVSYHYLDLSAVFHLFKLLGLLPKDMGGSLTDLVSFYQIDDQGFHDALGDAKMTLAVLQYMTNHLSGKIDLKGSP